MVRNTLKRPVDNSPSDGDESSEDELPEVVEDADDAEAYQDNHTTNSETESEIDQELEQHRKSKKSKKQKRSSKPCSRAKKDERGNRLRKAMLFKHKDEPVALGSLIASINSTVDKANCAENSGKRLLFSTTRRIARAKQFPRGTAFGHSLFCPRMAYMYSHMNAQDQVDTILRPMTLLWPSAQDRLRVAVSARTSKSERLQAHRSATSQQRGSRSVESRLPFPCAEVCLVGRYQNAQLLH